jgi:hypothetical protein
MSDGQTDPPTSNEPSSVISISGGVNVDVGRGVNIGSDVVGRDKVVSIAGDNVSGGKDTTFDQHRQRVENQFDFVVKNLSIQTTNFKPVMTLKEYVGILTRELAEEHYVPLRGQSHVAISPRLKRYRPPDPSGSKFAQGELLPDISEDGKGRDHNRFTGRKNSVANLIGGC